MTSQVDAPVTQVAKLVGVEPTQVLVVSLSSVVDREALQVHVHLQELARLNKSKRQIHMVTSAVLCFRTFGALVVYATLNAQRVLNIHRSDYSAV